MRLRKRTKSRALINQRLWAANIRVKYSMLEAYRISSIKVQIEMVSCSSKQLKMASCILLKIEPRLSPYCVQINSGAPTTSENTRSSYCRLHCLPWGVAYRKLIGSPARSQLKVDCKKGVIEVWNFQSGTGTVCSLISDVWKLSEHAFLCQEQYIPLSTVWIWLSAFSKPGPSRAFQSHDFFLHIRHQRACLPLRERI